MSVVTQTQSVPPATFGSCRNILLEGATWSTEKSYERLNKCSQKVAEVLYRYSRGGYTFYTSHDILLKPYWQTRRREAWATLVDGVAQSPDLAVTYGDYGVVFVMSEGPLNAEGKARVKAMEQWCATQLKRYKMRYTVKVLEIKA
mmetsp:Transcript_28599/g.31772  ORF Transcript_28599/g.31772 Transcript_28599/m.31772 type:complete len:145 (+) Transcript_28599:26-460(+)|eukprot:CAMPEP_0168529406 /NCGR_PEP_ID=MMETSP0405-20121227/13896_1 /TAXON_ID=498012 /ORGANISM="Trichosphaerium sp, Strain Am-I-7 wt" /LENGTH=144 /DNA_ID=CAMNT_0008553137 /DNA_START=20 /DNA_END=454 /DNA_ORIENTATION=+